MRPVFRKRSSGHCSSTRVWLSVPAGSCCCEKENDGFGRKPACSRIPRVTFTRDREARRVGSRSSARVIASSKVKPATGSMYDDCSVPSVCVCAFPTKLSAKTPITTVARRVFIEPSLRNSPNRVRLDYPTRWPCATRLPCRIQHSLGNDRRQLYAEPGG